MSVYTEEFKQYAAAVLSLLKGLTFHGEYIAKIQFMEEASEDHVRPKDKTATPALVSTGSPLYTGVIPTE